jgi:prepilin-type N-terminal cleavage/methylation domain-containing protein
VNQVIKTNSKGFTLIELLVVIAIIGILSTIAMTSLNGARKKAADASFKSTVTSIQAVGVLCCDAATPTLRGTVGTAVDLSTQTICTDTSVAGSYAASTSIGNVTLVSQCSGGAFSITVAKPANFAGNLASGTCTETQCTFA